MTLTRTQWALAIGIGMAGVGALGASWGMGGALPLALLAGAILGAGVTWAAGRERRSGSRGRDRGAERTALVNVLNEMGDLLHEMSPARLGERGGWDQGEFARVLRQVELLTPAFQAALIAYLAQSQPPRESLEALLAVDRLSAAYTYWTRLFPPRQGGESMFVLSLLHDLGEKVERALALMAGQG